MPLRILVVLACLMGLFGALPAHASELEDVFGREVPLGQGRPTVVLYANRNTRDVLREHALHFAYELRHQRPIVVVRVDLRGIPGFVKGSASREIRKIHSDSLDKVRELFLSQGQQPPADLSESLFMVADSNGAPHNALGLEKGFRQVLVQALSPRGRELARGPFPQAAGAISRAITAPSRSLLSAITR